jgi:hypothetical protein
MAWFLGSNCLPEAVRENRPRHTPERAEKNGANVADPRQSQAKVPFYDTVK